MINIIIREYREDPFKAWQSIDPVKRTERCSIYFFSGTQDQILAKSNGQTLEHTNRWLEGKMEMQEFEEIFKVQSGTHDQNDHERNGSTRLNASLKTHLFEFFKVQIGTHDQSDHYKNESTRQNSFNFFFPKLQNGTHDRNDNEKYESTRLNTLNYFQSANWNTGSKWSWEKWKHKTQYFEFSSKYKLEHRINMNLKKKDTDAQNTRRRSKCLRRKQIFQSEDEFQQIAVWWLLYCLRHPDQYPSRLQTIWRPHITPTG